MNPTPASPNDHQSSLRSRLAHEPGAILEALAVEHHVTLRETLECLPADLWQRAPGSAFVPILQDVASWGPVLVLVHTPDVILECHGPLPPGGLGRGFYNFEHGSPLRGHLRADHCADVFFVRRLFMGRDTRSIVFCNREGEGMFKIFVDRDEQAELRSEQVERFHALADRVCTAGESARAISQASAST